MIFNKLKKYSKVHLKLLNLYSQYLKDYNKLKKLMDKDDIYILSKYDAGPCIFDNVGFTQIEPVYFFQDVWFAKKIFESKPENHYDVGSSVKTLSMISQYIPITMVDIRPIGVEVENFNFVKGDILHLPFSDNSIFSLSSLCVIEHIGLGRYGDEIDFLGSEKAVSEIKRVLMNKGNLYISLPVDKSNKVYFNAHRAFTREYIMQLFSDLVLLDEKYIYGSKIFNEYSPEKGFGTGLFYFTKA